MKFRYFFIFTFLLTSITSATVRYVSKTGSSTPPYTTWETASDSIQKAIDVCEFGDTVYVGEGRWTSRIVLKEGVKLFGSGFDKTIIHTGDRRDQFGEAVILVNAHCTVSGFSIYSMYWWDDVANLKGFGMFADYERTGHSETLENIVIENNVIKYCRDGIAIRGCNVIVRNNIIDSCYNGLRTSDSFYETEAFINNNFVGGHLFGIKGGIAATLIVENNIIYGRDKPFRGYSGDWSQYALVKNNKIYSDSTFYVGITNWRSDHRIENNTIYGYIKYGSLEFSPNDTVINNSVVNPRNCYEYPDYFTGLIQYNQLYLGTNEWNGHQWDSTNFAADPMFVDSANGDFKLQKYSPLIDAGDPNIKDVDGSRSDIGAFGGLLGESYTYQDLPPKPPRGLEITSDDSPKLLWYRNTEADITHYNLYGANESDFLINTTTFITSLQDTSLSLNANPLWKKEYYKITAIDSLGQESEPSECLQFITGINDPEERPSEYKLYQNYPNPFNPSTIIGYYLRQAAEVRVIVYAVSGEVISTLYEGHQNKGYYEVRFDATNYSLPSGIYFTKFEVKNNNNMIIHTSINKMIYVK